MSRPSVVCQLCGYDDYLEYFALPDDVWEVTCSNPAHKPYTWCPTPYDDLDDSSGIAAELGLFDLLLELVPDDGPYDEYGIIEYRLGLQYPKEYSTLLQRYGHTAQARGKKYTMSAFLGGVLGAMYRTDKISSVWGPATGYWSYNGTIGHYAHLPGSEDDAETRSWNDFAVAEGLDPDVWPLVKPD